MKKIILSLSLINMLFAVVLEDASKINRTDPTSPDYILSFHNNIKESLKSCVDIKVANSVGSGVIISKDGYIITNYHVLKDSDFNNIKVFLNKIEHKATFIAGDDDFDLAVIKIDGDNFNAIKFADSNDLLVGDVVFAIGNPLNLKETVTKGIISGLHKNLGIANIENHIQIDAAIYHGNSGGALVNSKGDLIGINTQGALDEAGGYSAQGFAIPSNIVKYVALQLINNKNVKKPKFGFKVCDLDGLLKEAYDDKNGILVEDVEEDSPIYKAGLRRGDIIFKIDDKIINNTLDAKNYTMSKEIGSIINIEYERKGIKNKINFTIEAEKIESEKIFGLYLNSTKNQNGVLIKKIFPDSSFNNNMLAKEDIIFAIEDDEIKTIKDFKRVMKKYKNKNILKIWAERNNSPFISVIIK